MFLSLDTYEQFHMEVVHNIVHRYDWIMYLVQLDDLELRDRVEVEVVHWEYLMSTKINNY
jgi:hypothetical protein